MCFSSTASFSAAALLIPIAALGVRRIPAGLAAERLPLALTPALFGLQQGLEGLVWLGLEPGGSEAGDALPAVSVVPAHGGLAHAAALAYLFFAHAFWLVWMPWCALRFSGSASGSMAAAGSACALRGVPPVRRGTARPLQRALLVVGLAMGLWLWLPLLLQPWRLQPLLIHGNLHYASQLPFASPLGGGTGSLLYALVIALPLGLCGSLRLRQFALAVLLALALAWWGYRHALTSIWCLLAALLSPLLLRALREPIAPGAAGQPQVLPVAP